MKAARVLAVASGIHAISNVAGDVGRSSSRIGRLASSVVQGAPHPDHGGHRFVLYSPFAGSYTNDDGGTDIVLDFTAVDGFGGKKDAVRGQMFGGDDFGVLVRGALGDRTVRMIDDARTQRIFYARSAWCAVGAGFIALAVTGRLVLFAASLPAAVLLLAVSLRHAVYERSLIDERLYDVVSYLKKYGFSWIWAIIPKGSARNVVK